MSVRSEENPRNNKVRYMMALDNRATLKMVYDKCFEEFGVYPTMNSGSVCFTLNGYPVKVGLRLIVDVETGTRRQPKTLRKHCKSTEEMLQFIKESTSVA